LEVALVVILEVALDVAPAAIWAIHLVYTGSVACVFKYCFQILLALYFWIGNFVAKHWCTQMNCTAVDTFEIPVVLPSDAATDIFVVNRH
jgi:hypothetical protein